MQGLKLTYFDIRRFNLPYDKNKLLNIHPRRKVIVFFGTTFGWLGSPNKSIIHGISYVVEYLFPTYNPTKYLDIVLNCERVIIRRKSKTPIVAMWSWAAETEIIFHNGIHKSYLTISKRIRMEQNVVTTRVDWYQYKHHHMASVSSTYPTSNRHCNRART